MTWIGLAKSSFKSTSRINCATVGIVIGDGWSWKFVNRTVSEALPQFDHDCPSIEIF